MDKTFAFVQLIVTALAFLCIMACIVTQIVAGHVTSVLGYMVCALFAAMAWKMLRIAYKELREKHL